MTVDLRHLLSRAVEHASQYRQLLGENSGKAEVGYYDMRAALAAPLPEAGSAPEAVLEELVTRATPGLMPMAGPRFFGFVIGASHPAGVAADWMVSAGGQNTGYHTPTPAAAAMEEMAVGWLVDILSLIHI